MEHYRYALRMARFLFVDMYQQLAVRASYLLCLEEVVEVVEVVADFVEEVKEVEEEAVLLSAVS